MAGVAVAVAVMAAGSAALAAEPAATADVTPIAEVKGLGPQEFLAHPPFRIRGVVTWRGNDQIVVQDETTAIFCHRSAAEGKPPTLDPAIQPGTEVEITGSGERGGFGPRLTIETASVIGSRPLPEPRDVDPVRASEGAHDTEFVRLAGVVLGAKPDGIAVRLLLEAEGRTFTARIMPTDLPCAPADLVDAIVAVTGIAWPRSNHRGECMAVDLSCQGPERFRIVERPPATPFEAPRLAIDAIAAYSSLRRPGRLVQTEGTVIHAVPGEAIYLQDNRRGITVQCSSTESFAPGDRVAVAGFPDRSGQVVGLKDAIVRKVGAGVPPPPLALAPDAITQATMASWKSRTMLEWGDGIGCLVRFPATLVETRTTATGGEMLLRSGETILTAQYPASDRRQLARLAAGSELDVTALTNAGWTRALNEPPDRIGLVVRSAADVRLVRAPSWWTPPRLLGALAAVGAVLMAAIVWALMLRRQVAVQVTRLAGEIEKRREAALVFRATLAERNRLANNVHDTLLQGLAGAVLQIDACRFAILNRQLDNANGQLEKSKRMVQHAANDLRNSVWALRVAPLEGRTLAESLETVATHVTEGDVPRIVVAADDEGFALPDFVTGNLLFVAQEAIRNAVHHALCATVEVGVDFDRVARTVALTVRDDGRGFDPTAAAGTEQGHFGLQVMRERLAGMGGTLEIDTAPHRGTTIRATVAVEKA